MKYFFLYLIAIALFLALGHACVGAIDREAEQYLDHIDRFHAEVKGLR